MSPHCFFAGDRTKHRKNIHGVLKTTASATSFSNSNSQLCINDTDNDTFNDTANDMANDTFNDTKSKELPENFQQENASVESEIIEIKREVKNEIKLENFEEFETREQVGIDFITSNDFPDQNNQSDCHSKYFKSNFTVKAEHNNGGFRDFFCNLCSLQFDKKYVYDVHMKLVHPKSH